MTHYQFVSIEDATEDSIEKAMDDALEVTIENFNAPKAILPASGRVPIELYDYCIDQKMKPQSAARYIGVKYGTAWEGLRRARKRRLNKWTR